MTASPPSARSRTGMTRARWAYLKALRPAPPKYLHISAYARMVPNPINPLWPPVPWVQRPGVTYDVGRNKAKRAKRAAHKAFIARINRA